MNYYEGMIPSPGYFRGGEVASANVQNPGNLEAPMTPQTLTAIQGKAGEREALSEEREKQVELLMEQTKMFIRNIDVNSL